MALIPPAFIDDLLARIDIVEVIDSRVPLKKAGRDYKACCPFHNEKTPSFTVSPVKQFYYCFGCGETGTAISFLMAYERMEFPDAVRELAKLAGVAMPEGADEPVQRHDDELAALEQAAAFYRRQLKGNERAIAYLKQRGLSGRTAADFGIGFAPDDWQGLRDLKSTETAMLNAGLLIKNDDGRVYDRFRDRIMFPIRDRRGRIIGFGGRVLDKGEPKYLNSPETPVFHKGQELYGLYECRQAERDLSRIVVVEGYMDVVALAEHGVRNAVATLGTASTEEHIKRLFRVVPEIVFCFDGDRAGRQAAWRALENALPELREGRRVSFLFLPDGDDPDSFVRRLGADEFNQQIARATPLSSLLFDRLASDTNMDTLDGRARLVELARPHLERIPAGAYRDLLEQALAERSGLDAEKVSRMVNSPAQVEPPQAADQGALRMTPVRTAIALLLRDPGLAQDVAGADALRQSPEAGAGLLAELIESFQAHAGLTAAGLFERWRERPETRHLLRLLTIELPLPDDGLAREFNDAVGKLLGQAGQQNLDALIEKERREGLNSAERQLLKELLSAKRTGLQAQNQPESGAERQ